MYFRFKELNSLFFSFVPVNQSMKYRHFITFLGFMYLFAIKLNGQDIDKIKNLRLEVGSLPSNDANLATIYNELAWEYRKYNPDSTIYFAQQVIRIEKLLGISSETTKALNFIGVGYQYKGDYVKAYEYYHQALERSEDNDDKIQYAYSLNNKGRLYQLQGDFINSYDAFYKALEIFESLGNDVGSGYCYKSLSELYQSQQNYDKALEMSENAFRIRRTTENVTGQISILIEIADIYEKKNDHQKAFDHYLQAKVKAESINDDVNIATIDLGISKLYYAQDKKEEALIFASKADMTAAKTSNYDLISQVRLQLGKVYFKNGSYSKSRESFLSILSATDKEHSATLQRDAYFYLSELEKMANNVSASFDYYSKYVEVRQTLDNAEVARTIQRLESKYEISQKDQENEILKVQKARDQALIDRQKILNITLIIVVVAISLLLSFIWIMSRKRRAANIKLKERNEEVAAQREEISRQNEHINVQNQKLQKRNVELAQLNQEKDTLMNIVAHDLKSPFNRIKGIIQLFELTKLNAEQKSYSNLLSEITQSGIDLIRDLLDVNSFEEDRIKLEIRKVDACELILQKAKYFYADAKAKGIEVVTNVQDISTYLFTDEVYLSRILDNLISNAIKFSDAKSKVILSAVRVGEKIQLTIEDSGPGFSDEDQKLIYKKFTKLSARPTGGESSNGLGLAIVKTLVDRLEGEIVLESKQGKGSKFDIFFPIEMTKFNKQHEISEATD